MRRILALILATSLGGALAQTEKPQTLTWGAYTVKVVPRPDQDFNKEATATISQGGRTLVTVHDWSIEASLKALRPGGQPELLLEAYSGGAHCCTTYYAFTQDLGRVQNLFVLDAGNYGAEFRDLNGDGTLELLFSSDAFAYYDYSFAASPDVRYVLGWDGQRVADLTRRYAYVPERNAARYLKDLTRPLQQGEDPNELRKPALVGFLANRVAAGSGPQAEQTLTTQILSRDPGLRAWFAAHRSEILSTLYADPGARLSITDARVLPEKKKEGQ